MTVCTQCSKQLASHNVRKVRGRLVAFCFTGAVSPTWAPADIEYALVGAGASLSQMLPFEA